MEPSHCIKMDHHHYYYVCVFFSPTPESVRNTPSTDSMPAASAQTCCADHQESESATGSYLPTTQEEEAGPNLPTAHVRPSHPLKSFAVPAVPPTGAAYDPTLPSTPLLSQPSEYWGIKMTYKAGEAERFSRNKSSCIMWNWRGEELFLWICFFPILSPFPHKQLSQLGARLTGGFINAKSFLYFLVNFQLVAIPLLPWRPPRSAPWGEVGLPCPSWFQVLLKCTKAHGCSKSRKV